MSQTIKNCFSRLLPSMLAAALCLLPLSGCGGGPEPRDTVRVGVALYTQDDTFIASVVQNMERTAQETETDAGIKFNLSVVDGRNNQTTQLEQVDRFLARGYDVLCVNIVDRTAAAVVIDKAQEAGVPLIFFNRQPVDEDIRRSEQVYYIGVDAQGNGTLQGRLVLDAWEQDPSAVDRNGDGVLQYAMLEGEPGHQDALLRTEYSVKALTDAGVEVEKLASATANWNRGQASSRVALWLEEFGDQIEVIFSNNDDMALGAIDAFKAAGAGQLPLVVGVDATAPALESIAAGELYGTVLNDADGMAQAMVDLSLALWSGEDPADAVSLEDVHYVWLPYRQVTQENLSDFLET